MSSPCGAECQCSPYPCHFCRWGSVWSPVTDASWALIKAMWAVGSVPCLSGTFIVIAWSGLTFFILLSWRWKCSKQGLLLQLESWNEKTHRAESNKSAIAMGKLQLSTRDVTQKYILVVHSWDLGVVCYIAKVSNTMQVNHVFIRQ
jgi:hypothetical protein